MVFVTVISKGGSLKDTKFEGPSDTLYKKAGFRKGEDFELRHTWCVQVDGDKHYCKLWAKDSGRAGTENKYDLPPPIDNDIFYGSMIATLHSDDTIDEPDIDLKKVGWKKIYEGLFGGFEDLGESDSEPSEDELTSVPESKKTKGGYLKDGFVVDSDSDTEGHSDSETEDVELVEGDDNEDALPPGVDAVLSGLSDCSEEEYIYSDEE